MFVGISDDIKDRRVDRMLETKGYSNFMIFYSPITIWLVWVFLLLMAGGVYILFLIYKVEHLFYFILYLTSCYFYLAYFNNSIALTNDELIITNPNFPFKNLEEYKIKEIEKVRISYNKRLFVFYCIGLFGSNYIEIETKGSKKRYYCIHLSEDAGGENLTGKTIDDLNDSLKERNISVVFRV